MTLLSVIHISLLQLMLLIFFFIITDTSAGRGFTLFPWPNHIQHILPLYLFDWIDVIGDGNCGFRAIVVIEFGGEEAWPLLRLVMCMEMQMNREKYIRVHLSAETLDNVIFSVGSHRDGPAPFIHWLEAPMGLYFAATFLNIGIAYYGFADGNPKYSCLDLSLRRVAGVHSVNKVIHVCWVNRNHYV